MAVFTMKMAIKTTFDCTWPSSSYGAFFFLFPRVESSQSRSIGLVYSAYVKLIMELLYKQAPNSLFSRTSYLNEKASDSQGRVLVSRSQSYPCLLGKERVGQHLKTRSIREKKS